MGEGSRVALKKNQSIISPAIHNMHKPPPSSFVSLGDKHSKEIWLQKGHYLLAPQLLIELKLTYFICTEEK